MSPKAPSNLIYLNFYFTAPLIPPSYAHVIWHHTVQCLHFPPAMLKCPEQSSEAFELLSKQGKSDAKGFLMSLLFSGFPLAPESEFAFSSTDIPGKALFCVLC